LAFTAALPTWEFFESKDGALTPLRASAAPRASVNSLWGRRLGEALWKLELMLDDAADNTWIYRRHPDVTMPLTTAIKRSTEGLPHLAPEIQLLYKARNARPQDHADFARTAPALNRDARTWLRDALTRSESGHAWINTLDGLSLR
jgi:hypothetical protein